MPSAGHPTRRQPGVDPTGFGQILMSLDTCSPTWPRPGRRRSTESHPGPCRDRDTPFRGALPRLRPPWRRGYGRVGDESSEDRGGVGLHAGQDVLVGGDRERRGGMAEPFTDHFEWNTGFEEQGGVGVAEVVESDRA